MTEKLFYSQPYLTNWTAQVQEIIQENDKFLITLSQTAFYPTGGGQPCDKGFIDGIEVLDVFEKDNEIFHVVPAVPSIREVDCVLDFKRRFDHMQQHSGEHILSSIFFYKYNAGITGFHLGEDYVSIDAAVSELTDSDIKSIEETANGYIYKNIDIKTYYPEKNTMDALPLRKKINVDEPIRIVEVSNTDYCPCCGTHVAKTGEIGIIKIVKAEKYKGMTRVYFKCGKRALEDFQNKHVIVSGLSSHLSANENEILSKVENLNSEIKNAHRTIRELKETLYKTEAQRLTDGSENKTVSAILELPFDDAKIIAEQGTRLSDSVYIIASSQDNKLIAIHNGKANINLGAIFKEILPKFNGKGGGNAAQAQASFGSVDELIRFEEYLRNNIN